MESFQHIGFSDLLQNSEFHLIEKHESLNPICKEISITKYGSNLKCIIVNQILYGEKEGEQVLIPNIKLVLLVSFDDIGCVLFLFFFSKEKITLYVKKGEYKIQSSCATTQRLIYLKILKDHLPSIL